MAADTVTSGTTETPTTHPLSHEEVLLQSVLTNIRQVHLVESDTAEQKRAATSGVNDLIRLLTIVSQNPDISERNRDRAEICRTLKATSVATLLLHTDMRTLESTLDSLRDEVLCGPRLVRLFSESVEAAQLAIPDPQHPRHQQLKSHRVNKPARPVWTDKARAPIPRQRTNLIRVDLG